MQTLYHHCNNIMQNVASILSDESLNANISLTTKWKNVAIHAVAVIIIILIHIVENNPELTFFAGGGICVLVYSYIAINEIFRTSLRFNPISFYMAWYTVGMGFSAIYAGTVVHAGNTLSFVIKAVEPTDLALGYILFIVGSLSLHAGMEIFAPHRSDNIYMINNYVTSSQLLLIIALWAIGILMALFPEQVSWMGSFAAILQKFTPAAVLFIALNSPERFKITEPTYYALILIGTGGSFVASLMANSKATIMFSFFPLMWMFIFRRHLWRYFILLLIASTIFYFGIVAPVVMTARNLEMKEGETYAGRILRVYQSLETEGYSSAQQYQENGLELFLYRQFDAPAIGFLVDDVRAFGYRYGETMERLAYSLIPRIVWPEKPTVTVGGWFYTYAGGQKDEGDSDTSFGITATGECYWNFGIFGVIFGMFVIGVTIGGLWNLSGTDPRITISRIFLFYSVTLNIINMADWVSVITLNTVLFLMCYIGIRIQDYFQTPQEI